MKMQRRKFISTYTYGYCTHIFFSRDPPVSEVTGKNRQDMLFKTIVNRQKDVAVGPLEYCGNGTVIRTTHGKKRCLSLLRIFMHLTDHF
jgi:hypothetical protein